ncbi:hypothetical protein [Neobacillus sp. PS3-40]|uniref:hypothetical protein n=1 Tax=Neobacillus sp. PS3-40 TaxID=3070679 RepID=UPI0027DECF10|nr:hypothetical protein [Neobacillus sp. PS3-40]WML45398.1 hypothetical protein RCG20_05710 [Neobacillus sp. PS3-40]
MNIKLLCLSFFKEHKINYYFRSPVIIFNCLYCKNEIKLNVENGEWNCNNCSKKGNLFDLKDLITKGYISKMIYNPRKEKNKIKQAIKLIKNEINDPKIQAKIDEINQQVELLFIYFVEKESG